MVNVVKPMVNVHLVNVVVSMVGVVRPMNTVELVVNRNSVNVKILLLPKRPSPPLLLLILPFQRLLKVDVDPSMVTVQLVNVVVCMVGVVHLIHTADLDVNLNLESVIRL